jgi:hypothetical protein
MNKFLIAVTAAAVALPATSPTPALAQRHHDRGRFSNWDRARSYDYNHPEPGQGRYYADRYYRSGHYAERRLGRHDRIYRGRDGRYYCRRSDGSTGLIVGAALGGLIGNRVSAGGSETLGTILGATGGALLGREIARGKLRCR